ncbi:transketolase family protein [Nocardiopsis ansamitocini]|nr:transketolase C-terminal domain-containing protein [Nocardiopsis ansamitocini]
MRETFVHTLDRAMNDDPRLALVLAATALGPFARTALTHPNRVVNVGIREQLMITTAAGLALTGLRPVVHAPALVERAFGQLKTDLTHQDAGAVLVSTGASHDTPEQGRTRMAPGDIALLDTLPGWTVHVPGHADEVPRLLAPALTGGDRVYLRLSTRGNAAARPVGQGLVVVRSGSRRAAGTVIAVGPMLDRVLAATRELDVTVAYLATVRPFDRTGLSRIVARAGHADVMIVEPYLRGTSAHEIAEALNGRRHRQLGLGTLRHTEIRGYGAPDDHDRAHGLDTAGLARHARDFFLD